MKKIISICSAFVFAFTISMVQQVNAQDYQITFAGTGAATTVSSVEVENLSTCSKVTLNEGDILHLSSDVGTFQIETNNSSAMRIYPNPMTENSILELHPKEAGDAVITVYEMTGKTVAKIQTYLGNGRQEFRLSGLKNGLYLLNARGNSYQYSGKILCSGLANGNPGIEKVSNTNESNIEKISKKEFNQTQGTVDMYYTAGERLKFKASSGIYSTVKTDIPAEDKTLSFNFVPCTDGDNNNYPVVEIGGQIWMAENLKTTKYHNGELIGTSTPDTLDISGEEKPTYQWAYDGDESNVPVYGRLYTWFAVTDSRSICPTDWHLPSAGEWSALDESLGGYDEAYYKIRETGSAHWKEPNLYVTNETGFTMLPGGGRYPNCPGGERYPNCTFYGIGNYGSWWSSKEVSAESKLAYPYPFSQFGFGFASQREGKSVRCLRNIPYLITQDVTEITTTTAKSGGDITVDGGYPIIARGVCWSSLHTPTIEDSLTSDGTGTGAFTSSLTGLQPNLTYSIRAYATNSLGTGYGKLITFTTFPLWPTVSTAAISSITITSAISGGDVTNIGGANVTACGVCWSSLHRPTIEDSLTSEGVGIGLFTSSLTSLQPNRTYFIRAYATNSLGTGYGEQVILKTMTGQISDIDNNTYYTVTIGTQVWMAENLKTTKLNDGAYIPLVTDGTAWAALSTTGFCWYNNDSAYFNATYGALYNWYTVNKGILCPTGWHVPTEEEWSVIIDYLGGESVAGGKLKEAGFANWIDPNQDATNETSFTALPGGFRSIFNFFYGVGEIGYWWSSTEYSPTDVWGRYLLMDSGSDDVYFGDGYKQSGFSVRCLKDD